MHYTTSKAAQVREHAMRFLLKAYKRLGVAADISHINTKSTVTGYQPDADLAGEGLSQCLKGSQIVLIPAGVPRKPGMTRDGEYIRQLGVP